MENDDLIKNETVKPDKKVKEKRKKTVYISALGRIDEGESPLSCGNWSAGWNNRQTAWYKFPVDKAEFERHARMHGFEVGEGWGYQA